MKTKEEAENLAQEVRTRFPAAFVYVFETRRYALEPENAQNPIIFCVSVWKADPKVNDLGEEPHLFTLDSPYGWESFLKKAQVLQLLPTQEQIHV